MFFSTIVKTTLLFHILHGNGHVIYVFFFRQTGAYAQILWRILVHDFLQFFVVFLVILLAFSGSFILSLKGEHSVDVHNETRYDAGGMF